MPEQLADPLPGDPSRRPRRSGTAGPRMLRVGRAGGGLDDRVRKLTTLGRSRRARGSGCEATTPSTSPQHSRWPTTNSSSSRATPNSPQLPCRRESQSLRPPADIQPRVRGHVAVCESFGVAARVPASRSRASANSSSSGLPSCLARAVISSAGVGFANAPRPTTPAPGHTAARLHFPADGPRGDICDDSRPPAGAVRSARGAVGRPVEHTLFVRRLAGP